MRTDYQGLMDVIKQEVKHAMSTECKVEDNEGRDVRHKISGISVHLFERCTNQYHFVNSFLEKKESNRKIDLMVRVIKKNLFKTSKTDCGYSDVPMTPIGFKIFFRRKLDSILRTAIQGFFQAKKKESESSIDSPDRVETYHEPVGDLETISDEAFDLISEFSKKVYRTPSVISTDIVLKLTREVNIVIDNEGREILQHKCINSCMFVTRCLNSKKIDTVIPAMFYACDQKEFAGIFPGFARRHLGLIEGCREIKQLRSGFYPMLFSPAATETLFHEAILGHMLSGKLIANQEATVFKDKIGFNISDIKEMSLEPLRDIKITVNPLALNKIGSYRFDNEGIRAEKFVILDRGKIKNFLLHRNSAARMKTTSNGHARSGGYMNDEGDLQIPEPRISHYEISAYRQKTKSDLIRDIVDFCKKNKFDSYLVVKSFSGVLDAKKSLFTMELDICRKVRLDGREETFVGGTISGSPFDLLANIKAFGSEQECVNGYCGSTSGYVPISADVPPLFFYGHYVADKIPEPKSDFDIKRDKIIPENF